MNKLNRVKRGYKEYNLHGGGFFLSRGAPPTGKTIPPGVYSGGSSHAGLFLVPMNVTTDQLIKMPNTTSEQVVNDLLKFWSPETRAKFDNYGFIYKRGILLYGAPGTGKTCTIASVMEQVVGAGGIVLFNPNSDIVPDLVNGLREIEPNKRVLVVFEEFDERCDDPSFLSLLDGEAQLEDVVYLATTNYIDDVPERIKNRPSRFALVLDVGAPNREARTLFLQAKLKGADLERVEEWADKTEGLVIDQLKDLIVSVCCLDVPLDEAIDKIRKMEALAQEREGYDEDDDYDSDEKKPGTGAALCKTLRSLGGN